MADETTPHYASGTVRAGNADAGDPDRDGAQTDPHLGDTAPRSDQGDDGSTTGDEVSADGGFYVGRVAGQDVGYAGETGAERRAEAEDVG